jgi:hypothetical protein
MHVPAMYKRSGIVLEVPRACRICWVFNRNSTGMNQFVDLSPMRFNTSIRNSFQQSWCGHMWQLHCIDAFIEGVRNWRAMAVWMAQLAGTHHLGLASVFRKNLHLLASVFRKNLHLLASVFRKNLHLLASVFRKNLHLLASVFRKNLHLLASVFRKNLHLLAHSHGLPTKFSLVTHTTPGTFSCKSCSGKCSIRVWH